LFPGSSVDEIYGTLISISQVVQKCKIWNCNCSTESNSKAWICYSSRQLLLQKLKIRIHLQKQLSKIRIDHDPDFQLLFATFENPDRPMQLFKIRIFNFCICRIGRCSFLKSGFSTSAFVVVFVFVCFACVVLKTKTWPIGGQENIEKFP
jgi:hypothetical protein